MIYEVSCTRCGTVFYEILFDDEGKHETSCPNCLAPYPHLTFKAVKPNELLDVDSTNPTLTNEVRKILATGKIHFCPIHMIPTTTEKCPICGRKAHAIHFDLSHLPDSLINLIVNSAPDEDVTTILEIVLHILVEYDVPKRLTP